jgi:cysteine desulfurase
MKMVSVYLDNNATTRPTKAVVEAMQTYLSDCYFNPSSSTTGFTGADTPRREASIAMAKISNAEEPECFTFTSGATESNNWVLFSVASKHTAGRILISPIEHASISEPAAELSRRGFEVIEIPVDEHGVIHLDALRSALNKETILVSIMAANNETGVLEPISEIGNLIRGQAPNALFHTDATQAIGKIPVDFQTEWSDVDLASFSGHKFHGPKGVGGLYIRRGIEIPPFLLGGRQEEGRRSGTTNTPGLAGIAAAVAQWNSASPGPIAGLRDQFEAELMARFPEVKIHSNAARRLPNTSCFSLPAVVGEDLAAALATRGIIVGTGSACASGAMHPPKTLLAMGIDYEVARAALRVSLSTQTSTHELDDLLSTFEEILKSCECGTAEHYSGHESKSPAQPAK